MSKVKQFTRNAAAGLVLVAVGIAGGAYLSQARATIESEKPAVPASPEAAPQTDTPAPPSLEPVTPDVEPEAPVSKPAAPNKPGNLAPERPQQTAAYDLRLDCVEDIRREPRPPTDISGPAYGRRTEVVEGHTLEYEFHFDRDAESGYPVVEHRKSCTLQTVRTAEGAEPNLSITLWCEGEATYTANPKPTSATAHAWGSPSELAGGFEHVMEGPKSDEHLTEDVRCVVSVVGR